MFKALLVSVVLGADGHPIEKTWGAFLDLGECNVIAGMLTNSVKLDKGKARDAALVFRCDPVKSPKK